MTRDQANALLRKHNPLKEADPEGWPTVYMDWVIDAVMEAVKLERAKNDVLLEEIAHRLTQQKIWNGSGWTYHNVPPFVYLKLVEKIGAARKEST